MNEEIYHIRNDYFKYNLTEDKLIQHPLVMFANWLNEAIATKEQEANAMNLATIGKDQRPHNRIVLLRSFDEHGLVFYTNYLSRKGEELQLRPYASVTFFWPQLQRQVRINASIQKISKEESDAYFKSRPRESQLSAWASPQSEVIENRDVLINRYNELLDRFGQGEIPRPAFWGGYRLVPDYFEFWQGGAHRLHDRFEYKLMPNGDWHINRLAP